jgi:hypothetical protein
VVLPYAGHVDGPTLAGIGYLIQVALLDRALARGDPRVAVDADRLLRDRPGQLAALYEGCGIPFEEAMLSWPADPNPRGWCVPTSATTGCTRRPGPRPACPVSGSTGRAARAHDTSLRPAARPRPVPDALRESYARGLPGRGGAVRIIAYDDVLRAARQQFLTSASIGVEQLSQELAVSRATLYRVMPSQDRLLGDVLWQLTERTLELAVRAAAGQHGADRILAISHRFEAAIVGFEPLQRWVHDDPLQASRVLFTPAGGIHERVVKAWAEIFVDAVARSDLTLPCDPEGFAYLYVRMGETLLHGELLAGVSPDPRTAERLRRVMLEGQTGWERPTGPVLS